MGENGLYVTPDSSSSSCPSLRQRTRPARDCGEGGKVKEREHDRKREMGEGERDRHGEIRGRERKKEVESERGREGGREKRGLL